MEDMHDSELHLTWGDKEWLKRIDDLCPCPNRDVFDEEIGWYTPKDKKIMIVEKLTFQVMN